MNKKADTREMQFAFKVRHALDRNLENLPASTTQRLAAARSMALARKKTDAPLVAVQHQAQLAGHAASGSTFGWLGRLSVLAPILLGIVLFVGLHRFEEQNRINELADIDSAILVDELPIAAYLDHGFKAFLAEKSQ